MFALMNSVGLFLLAAPPASGGAEGPSMAQTFIFMGLIFVVFWFFMIRPQRQKQKRREAMLKTIEKGHRIATIGGIRGTVTKVSEDVVTIKVDSNCKIDFSRSAIAEVILDEQEKARRVADAKAPNKKVGKSETKEDNQVEIKETGTTDTQAGTTKAAKSKLAEDPEVAELKEGEEWA